MSDETTYAVEYAKSNRSKCKKCKDPIAKGVIRICVETPGKDFTTSSSYHTECFKFPRMLGKISASDFVSNMLMDKTDDGSILPDKCDELIASIEKAQKATPKKKNDDTGPLKEIKAAYEAQKAAADQGERPSKKKKQQAVELYAEYNGLTVDKLKDILSWNRQFKTGTKDILLFKVIDGAQYGRLAPCPLDGEKLKFNPDCTGVVCSGHFDEATKTRLECAYHCSQADAPRVHPWFTKETTEEEAAEMDKLIEAAKGNVKSEANEDLLIKADKLTWDLSSRDGMRQAANDMLELLTNGSTKGKTINLPKENALLSVGKTITANKDLSAREILALLIEDYGYVEDKEAKAAAKHQALKIACAHPGNAAVTGALSELADLYFKEGNNQAGGTYKKVVKILSELPFEVTASNAMGLSKGKTKVPGIGKSSAEKIHEFITTGTIEKLEEKRKLLASTS